MQPYHVPSIAALKKRVKQFHNELKSHTTDSVPLGWCRDFTAKILYWENWNALHKAHDKPLGELAHRYKLFSRRFMHTHAEIKDLQAASREALREDMPSLSDAAIDACVKKLWHQRAVPLRLPDDNKVAVKDIPDEYWLDNTYIEAQSEDLYLHFITQVIAPVAARNGGVLVCNEKDYPAYYRALAAHTDTVHVLDNSVDLREVQDEKAVPLHIILDDGPDFWGELCHVWGPALSNAGVNGDQVNLHFVAQAITTYYKLMAGGSPSLDSLYDTFKDRRDFEKLPDLLKGDMDEDNRRLLTELERIVGNTASLSIRSNVSNAHNTMMSFCGVREKGKKVTIDALREMSTPLLIVAPDPVYGSSCNGYIAGIVDLLCVKLRNYGHHIQPTGNAYDNRPPRILATPYNARFAPGGMGITCITNTPSGWGLVSGGHPEVSSWNGGPNRTCVATYIANVGNHIDINEVPRRFFRRPRNAMTWYSHRHPVDPENMYSRFYPEESRQANFRAISLTL